MATKRASSVKKPTSKANSGTAFFKGKTVLITGGTGTFGKAFVHRLLQEKSVKKIIILSRDELKQSEMQSRYAGEDRLRFFLGDIRDVARLRRAFEGVDIVVHAAALKQVPATEYNPFEAIQTNVIGSKNVIDAALDCGVEKVLLVSSDKAVEPINLYGATKLCAERLFVAANVYSSGAHKTKFSVVRYGNVIGSRGSLVEIIERERALGNPIKLTDERMTRFWLRITDVMEIVFECVTLMQGAEIFVPKMKHKPIKDVIKLLAPDAKIHIVGIRPGEKLHEILLTEHETRRAKDLPLFFVVTPDMKVGDHTWLNKYPSVVDGFKYVSNNNDFLLLDEEAIQLFKQHQ